MATNSIFKNIVIDSVDQAQKLADAIEEAQIKAEEKITMNEAGVVMKATGIVRRVDDLGRVVIPKEIRRILNIKEGDPLEVHISEDGVCFKKICI